MTDISMQEPTRSCHGVTSVPTPAETSGKICIFGSAGATTPKACVDQLQLMSACLEQKGSTRFLFDKTSAPLTSRIAAQYFFIHEQVESLEVSRNWKIAILVAPEDDSREFLEMTARNAGYAFRCFRDREKAMAWLRR